MYIILWLLWKKITFKRTFLIPYAFCLLIRGNIKKTLALVSQTADSICDGDLAEKLIRQKGHWSMLPMQVLK